VKGALNSLTGTVSVNGAILTYLVEGSGTPVMVIGSAIYYPRTFSSGFRTSCRVACTDLRHFAERVESSNADKIQISTYINDIERVREAIGFKRFVLIGHSHHGNLALEYAKQQPDRVSHLVLIGTPPCGVQKTIHSGKWYWDLQASEARKAILERNRASLGSKDPSVLQPGGSFVAQYVADGPKYWYDTAYDAAPLWEGVPLNMEALEAFKSFFVDYELPWDPVCLNVPILVVMGRHDYAVPHTLWDMVLPKVPNVTYRLLENSGHTPQLEESSVFEAIFFEWLEQESGASHGLGHVQ
jgi:proline iminopeptidase